MSYNVDAQVFETQIVVTNTTQPAGVTSGSIINKGSLSTFDTYVTGHTVINDVKITPNKNDIIFEQQAVLANNQNTYVDITDFTFDDNICNSFKAIINVTVSAAQSKLAVWEINGLYKPDGWVITSSFTGDITGVQFSIVNKEGGIAQIQYVNSNTSGTTTIRYRATTTAPPGSTPLGVSTGVVTNTSGPFLTNNLVYASSTDTLATTDLVYNSNVFKIGGLSRIVGENASAFVNFSNGGAITSMGDASVAKNMIVGEKIGIANTAPSYQIDVAGDINFTGSLFKNGSLYSGSEIWTTGNGNEVFYTAGNVGLGTTDPAHQLDVVGGIKSSAGITTSSIISTNATIGSVSSTDVFATNATVGSVSSTNVSVTNATIGSVSSTNVSMTNVTVGTLGFTNASGTNITASGLEITGDAKVDGPAFQIPSGNIAARPAAPVSGQIRYNSETNQFEGFGPGNAWGSLGGVVDIAQTTKILASGSPSTTDGNLYFYTVGSERVRVNSSGNVGVGTTAPSALLDVNGTANITTSLTTGAVYAPIATITTGTVGTLVSSNANVTTGTVGTLLSTNANVTTGTVGTLVASSATVTNANVTNVTVSNIVSSSSTLGNFYGTSGTMGGNFIPSVDVTYSLGSSTNRWKDLYLASGTLYLGDKPLSLTGDTFTLEKMSVTSTDDSLSVTSGAFVVSGGMGVNGRISSVGVNSSAGTIGSLLGTNGQFTNLTSTNIIATTISGGTVIATTYTGGTMSLSGDLIIGGTLTTVNITTTNVVDTNISSGTLTSNSITSTSGTIGTILSTNANVTTGTVGTLISTNANVTTGTVGTLVSTTATVTNASVTTGTIGTLLSTNANVTTGTVGTLLSTNATVTNASVTTGTVGTLLSTNANVTTGTVGTLVSSNANVTTGTVGSLVSTSISTSNLNVSSNSVFGSNTTIDQFGSISISDGASYKSYKISSSQYQYSQISSSNYPLYQMLANNVSDGYAQFGLDGTAGGTGGCLGIQSGAFFINTLTTADILFGTNNALKMRIRNSGIVDITTGLSTGNIINTNSTITNLQSTNITVGTLVSTNANVTTISAGTAVATTYTGGSMSLSGNLTLAGTLTTVNITTTNISQTNVSAGTILATNISATTQTVGTSRITTNLLALGNSNTIGSIFTTNGNVGIGTTTPVAPLHVVGTTSATSAVGQGIFMGTYTDNHTFIQLNSTTGSYIDFAASGDDNQGRILYNIADDYFDIFTNGSVKSRISSSGDLTMIGDITAFGSISDRRFKENIQNIGSDLALAKVKALRPVTFTWNNTVTYEQKRGTTDAGFIAQEVEQVVEYAVDEFQDIPSGDVYKKLKHERIIPYLVGAIQELERKIANLEGQQTQN
jgi:hypothetical protein